MLNNKKLVCFDLDGTLLDSVGIWNQIDAALIQQLSGQSIDLNQIQAERDQALQRFCERPDPYLDYCGMLQQQYKFKFTPRAVKDLRYQISHHFLDHVVAPKPDADVFIQQLQQRGLELVLATTTSLNNIQRYCQNNYKINQKINFNDDFSFILTREDVTKIKPDPEVYLKALQHFDLAATECLVVEDSLIGVQAALAAGIQVLAIYDQYSAQDWAHIQALATYSATDYQAALAALL